MNDYTDCPKEAVEQVIEEGYDVVLMDSWAEVTSMVQDQKFWISSYISIHVYLIHFT